MEEIKQQVQDNNLVQSIHIFIPYLVSIIFIFLLSRQLGYTVNNTISSLFNELIKEKRDLHDRLMVLYEPRNFYNYKASQQQEEPPRREQQAAEEPPTDSGVNGFPPEYVIRDIERRIREQQREDALS